MMNFHYACLAAVHPLKEWFFHMNYICSEEKSQFYVDTIRAISAVKTNAHLSCKAFGEKIVSNPGVEKKIHSSKLSRYCQSNYVLHITLIVLVCRLLHYFCVPSELKLLCNWRSVGQSVSLSWCWAPSGTHDQILDSVWLLLSCPCGAPTLTREGDVYRNISLSLYIPAAVWWTPIVKLSSP
jgi:hypothetical protein